MWDKKIIIHKMCKVTRGKRCEAIIAYLGLHRVKIDVGLC